MADKPISERQQLALDLAAMCMDRGYCNPFGGDVEQVKSPTGRVSYEFAFSYPRLLDASCAVYSLTFIIVRLRGPMARIGENFKFTNADRVRRFFDKLTTAQLDQAAEIATEEGN